jgi:hypothetical protein
MSILPDIEILDHSGKEEYEIFDAVSDSGHKSSTIPLLGPGKYYFRDEGIAEGIIGIIPASGDIPFDG